MDPQRPLQGQVGIGGARGTVDVLLVNPPSPDGGIWIRSQHRVGRRSREGMIWAQVELAQLAALLHPYYSVEIVDAIATRLSWPEFSDLLRRLRPRYYVTQVTAPTLTNDMYGAFLARSLGARTIAFGTHVTPMATETMSAFPALDFVLRGEPELTLRELVDTVEEREIPDWIQSLMRAADPEWSAEGDGEMPLDRVKGLVWRRKGEITPNPPRPFIPNLDALPLPLHRLLPLERYHMPMLGGPYTFVVTSRGCPAGCRFCIKHVTYGQSVRARSPEHIIRELRELQRLGVHTVHMYADLFTVNRDQVIELCRLMSAEDLRIRWTCNSRVDFVDRELLSTMAEAGCWLISWGIESASAGILRRVHKGYRPGQAEQALRWAREAGIKNWGYFIVGLPGETKETIDQTIALAKRLPLDLALFHIAAPHPGTPFYREVIEQGWFRPGAVWEDVDMDRSTVLAYPHLSAGQLEAHAKRAFRQWALRPGPLWTFLKSINSAGMIRSAFDIGMQHLVWITARHPGQ